MEKELAMAAIRKQKQSQNFNLMFLYHVYSLQMEVLFTAIGGACKIKVKPEGVNDYPFLTEI